MTKQSLWIALLVAAVAFTAGGSVAFAGGDMNKQKDSRGEASMKQSQSDRGEPGINAGGQVIPPGEGEQTGRPGTIGGAATLPPQDQAPSFEGADKQGEKKKRSP